MKIKIPKEGRVHGCNANLLSGVPWVRIRQQKFYQIKRAFPVMFIPAQHLQVI